MNGYSHIQTFTNGCISADLFEDVFAIPDESDDSYIVHEIKLSLGAHEPLVLWPHDILPLVKVLHDALEKATERTGKFYRDEELSKA